MPLPTKKYREEMTYTEFMSWSIEAPQKAFVFSALGDYFPRVFKKKCYIVPTDNDKLMYASDEELCQEDFAECKKISFAVAFDHNDHWLVFCGNHKAAKYLM